MILLDTDVVSEPLKPAPDPRVLAWIDAQPILTLCLSIVTVAELRFGVAAMPAGQRRDRFHRRLEQEILPLFEDRLLVFDLAASEAYAKLMVAARNPGLAIG